MSQTNALRVVVADLRRPGATRDLDVRSPVPDVRTDAVEVPVTEPVRAKVHLERVSDGVVDELFETEPVEGETYRLEHDLLDLEPLVRDALVLELPHTPLCDPDCRGLCPNCGTDRNTSSCDCADVDPDPRWAALRSLDL
jgi:uncharacterized metal-binding protein YceD (DUF177 family)